MNKKRHWGMLLSILLLLTVVAGGTLAYVVAKTGMVENQFEKVQVSCEVLAEDNEVKLRNTSDVEAYIRAAIVVNWMDEDGNLLGVAPVKTTAGNSGHYAYDLNETVWEKDAETGFYYYVEKVAARVGTTDALLSNITITKPEGFEDYELSIEVLAEAIQADGVTADGTKTAYQDAWGVTPLED